MKLIHKFLTFFVFFHTILFLIYADEKIFPKPIGFVNDFANILNEEKENQISRILIELNEKTGAELVIVTLKTLNGEDYIDYATKLFERWQIGKKGKDNGILILLALQERKIKVEVGYGLEGILPDGKVGGILDTYSIPYLASGDYGRGITEPAKVIVSIIAHDSGVTIGESKNVVYAQRSRKGGLGGLIFILIIFFFLGRRMGFLPMFLMLSSMGRGFSGFGGSFGGGGGFSGFGGGFSGGGGAGRSF